MGASRTRPLRISALAAAIGSACLAATSALAQQNAPRVMAIPAASADARDVDFENARPRPLPMNKTFSWQKFKKELVSALDKDGSFDQAMRTSKQNRGDGGLVPGNQMVAVSRASARVQPEQWGTANLPFSTARADLEPNATNTQWPYRAAGKLFFVDQGDTYVCSASMIDRGLVVTAAHCVSEFGKNRYFSGFKFIPGYRQGAAPFGTWKAAKVYVLAGYPDGSAPCDYGVVCRDDIAVMALEPQKDPQDRPYYAGERTGWFAYAYGPAPYTKSGITHVTQIGYPVCLDDGQLMQRNDAQGAHSATNRDNTVFGSLMCGGSSGGPWVANFGIEPALTDTVPGTFAKANVVVGVTSWGATDKKVKQQGASPFLSSNIQFLVKAACNDYPDACAP